MTNASGRDRAGRRTIDLLRAGHRLMALFAPEHGLAGDAAAGAPVASGVDAASGAPVHSLYGERTRPSREQLADVDVLVYDVQDVAARCYTYASTLAEVLRAAAEAHLPVVVLDRPDPLGALAPDGPVLDPRFASFVGAAPVPLRYAMTPGELASLYRELLGIACELAVVELDGWQREWLDDAGLEFAPPSPALRSLAACAVYAGTVLLEATNVSVGRGTAAPFEWIGAPWLDAERLARLPLEGLRLVPEERAPGRGVRLELTDRARLAPVASGVRLLAAIRDAHADLAIDAPRFDRLAGTDALRLALEAGESAERIVASWRGALDAFAATRRKHLRY